MALGEGVTGDGLKVNLESTSPFFQLKGNIRLQFMTQLPETHSSWQGEVASGVETFPTDFSEIPSSGGGTRMREFRKTSWGKSRPFPIVRGKEMVLSKDTKPSLDLGYFFEF